MIDPARAAELDVDSWKGVTARKAPDVREAEVRFHAAAAARIAAREALDAAELELRRASAALVDAETRRAEGKNEAGIEARKQLNLIRDWLRDHGPSVIDTAYVMQRVERAIARVEEHFR